MGGKLCRLVGRYFFMSQYLLQGCHTLIKAKFPVFHIFPWALFTGGMYPSMQWGMSDSGLWEYVSQYAMGGRGVCLWVQGSVHPPGQTPPWVDTP